MMHMKYTLCLGCQTLKRIKSRCSESSSQNIILMCVFVLYVPGGKKKKHTQKNYEVYPLQYSKGNRLNSSCLSIKSQKTKTCIKQKPLCIQQQNLFGSHDRQTQGKKIHYINYNSKISFLIPSRQNNSLYKYSSKKFYIHKI